jgi:hypothetical protein
MSIEYRVYDLCREYKMSIECMVCREGGSTSSVLLVCRLQYMYEYSISTFEVQQHENIRYYNTSRVQYLVHGVVLSVRCSA